MLVTCPCGKKLNLADNLAGKKVRCPVCREVFLAAGEEVKTKPTQPGIKEQKQPKLAKAPARPEPADEEEPDFLEEVEDDEPESSGKKRKKINIKKQGTSWVRNLISSIVLVLLLAVAGVVYYYKLNQPGIVLLDINVPSPTVLVDGKPVPIVSKEEQMGNIEMKLWPGDHEVKVSKDGFREQVRKINVASGSNEHHSFVLQVVPKTK